MKIMIKEIEPNKIVSSFFVLDSFELRLDRNNREYILLTLRDKSGAIKAFIWNVSHDISQRLKERTILSVTGYSRFLDNFLVIDVYDWRYAKWDEVDIRDFVEVVKEGINHWVVKLNELVDLIEDPYCKGIIKKFLNDEEFMRIFKKRPAGISIHHNYVGGLLEHTVSTMSLSALVADKYPDVLDKNILLTGAFLHDIGKTKELSGNITVEYTTEGELLGHITLGILMLEEKISLFDEFPQELGLHLKHIILSHHGKLEYGSPVVPKTPEAIVVSTLEGLDAKFNHLHKILKNSDTHQVKSFYDSFLDLKILTERSYKTSFKVFKDGGF
ncbi:MAG: HD domain-containing protein [Thermodesulfovibrio sp.]|nr:HD domain-containing protein [Thermodesulfovibrio sp.]MDW7972789.1 HD domain-containing protein [Thermodesulfovibrio sp.]